MSARRNVVFATAVLMGAVLTGCAGAGQGGSEERAQSPLEKLFEQLDGGGMSDEERQQEWSEQSAKTEELVAQCMQKEGFEYIPANNGEIDFGDPGEWQPEKREWVAQYGYGAVNWPGRDNQPDPGKQPQDPNSDYVMSLSEAEQTAYYEVLYGPTQEDPEAEWTWEDGGCYGWASHETGANGDDLWSSEEATTFFDALNEFQSDTPDDPRIDKADSDWSTCMADAGFAGFAKQIDAQNSIYDEINAHYESQTEWIEKDPALDAIGEKEVALALADLDCRASTNYTKRAQEAQFELEAKFIAEHKPEIDALLALVKKK